MELQGKIALITGAARRIGREIALTLARRGASIVIHYHHSAPDALKLKEEIESAGTKAYLIPADFSAGPRMLPRIKRFLAQVYRKVPRLDILINNAADFYPTPFGKVTEKDWDHFLDVNLKAPFFLSQEIGMRMVQQKRGKIVNLVDWTALRPPPQYLPYAVSKAGLIALTVGLAKGLAPWVQVLSLAPGPILPAAGQTAKEQKAAAHKTLLKRFGDPRDIAQTVRFFVEDTDFITGAFIPVDGGALIA